MLDTSVLVAAFRSQKGASRALVKAALESRIQFLISNPLVLEYEAVLSRPEHLQASGLDVPEVGEVIDLICSVGIQVAMIRSWRPLLRDPDDEMVLGTAINGHADAIVTFNHADFTGIPEEFGIEVMGPRVVLERMGIK